MKEFKVKMIFTEEMLGSANANPDIHREYIASKAPDAESIEEEVAAIGVDGVEAKDKTVFARDENGNPIVFDYHIKGWMKDACKMCRRWDESVSKKFTAYRQEIDGAIFVKERRIPIMGPDGKPYQIKEEEDCQRPLRASTPMGERVALATSETVPAGCSIEFTVVFLSTKGVKPFVEWLDYGAYRGFGQWRNSGKGRFNYEIEEIVSEELAA